MEKLEARIQQNKFHINKLDQVDLLILYHCNYNVYNTLICTSTKYLYYR
jgi:hypothetical protein